MTKIHAVGQNNYTKDCITVYIQAAIFEESPEDSLKLGELELRCICHLVHMVPPVWWAAPSGAVIPFLHTVVRVCFREMGYDR